MAGIHGFEPIANDLTRFFRMHKKVTRVFFNGVKA